MGATEFEKPLDNDLATINTNLGSPASASGVTGADAFTKINTLNSKLTKHSFGSKVSLTDSTPYTCPYDGYIIISAGNASYNSLNIFNGSSWETVALVYGNNGHSDTVPIFVREGTYVSMIGSGGTGVFYPLV